GRRSLAFEEGDVENLRNRGTIDMGKVTLLGRPIEHARQPLECEGPFRVVAVSRLSKRKGRNVLNLIEAFERFLETDPQASLQVLGDGSIMREVRRAARDANGRAGAERIRVLGPVPDPAPLVRPAHVRVGASYCAL